MQTYAANKVSFLEKKRVKQWIAMFAFKLITGIGNMSYLLRSWYCLVQLIIKSPSWRGPRANFSTFVRSNFETRHGGSTFTCPLKCLCDSSYIMSFKLPCLTMKANIPRVTGLPSFLRTKTWRKLQLSGKDYLVLCGNLNITMKKRIPLL